MLRMVAGDSDSAMRRVSAREPNRLAGLDVAFDDQAQHLARAVVQDCDRGRRCPQTGTGVGQDAAQGANPLNCHAKM